MIQICRRILLEDGPNKELLVKVISYILARFSNVDYPAPAEYAIFNDPLYLHGVFAVLSNSFDVRRGYCLLKCLVTSSTYYVTEVRPEEHKYVCWKLPITSDSTAEELPFSPRLLPISSVPFRCETMFPDPTLLDWYYVRVLKGDASWIITPTLSFLILASLQEFVADQAFLGRLLKRIAGVVLPAITFTNSHPIYASWLTSPRCDNEQNTHDPGGSLRFFPFSVSEIRRLGEVTESTLLGTGPSAIFVSDLLS
jgi:hypothetical protein